MSNFNTNVVAQQIAERNQCLEDILESGEPKKLIVAGPGTGKTYTFGELLKRNPGGRNLVLTFIRRLVHDLESKLENYAEVATFHKYCKKVLHQVTGHFELVPYLTKVVERDAQLLRLDLHNFDAKFRQLKEQSDEVAFYLKRGDYYDVVSFNDSVYRLYEKVKESPNTLPQYDQIVIDEFQDFNKLEFAFIGLLAQRGNILIVGDDDQAIYRDSRDASPDYLRNLYQRPSLAKFELPYCSRCPLVIVKAVNALVETATNHGHLKGRIPKRFEGFIADKKEENSRYRKIMTVQCSTVSVVASYVEGEITKIPSNEMKESHEAGEEYPTVLVIGPKHYLEPIAKRLRQNFSRVSYAPPKDFGYGLVEAYENLVLDQQSNLGWRILTQELLGSRIEQQVIAQSAEGTPMTELLDSDFLSLHRQAVEELKGLRDTGKLSVDQKKVLRKAVGDELDALLDYFMPAEVEEEVVLDTAQPSILLTSYLGSKGLSGGHVFIVGANNGEMPRNAKQISDQEISQFIVALTRTRKQSHIVSSRWLIAPVGRDQRPIPASEPSVLTTWLPAELKDDQGYVRASDLS